ncbi:uncharacterized protein ACBR49_017794 [Aulostomus maculatus]
MCAVQLLRVSVHERILAAAEDFLLQLEKGEEAAEVPVLRALLTERLTAAAEQIVALLEETVAEYEDRVELSEREICRQRRLLDAVLKPEVRLHRAVIPADVQQLLGSQEEVPPEQQEWSSRVEQEQPEPPHIKEEQEELWTNEDGDIKSSTRAFNILDFGVMNEALDSNLIILGLGSDPMLAFRTTWQHGTVASPPMSVKIPLILQRLNMRYVEF